MRASAAWAQGLQRAWLERGPLARALLPLATLYGLLQGLHRRSQRPERIDVPVLVVGNLIAGGAGKTPTVLALLELLRRAGWHPGVVSRGYGRRDDTLLDVAPDTPASAAGDEPLLLRLRGGVPVVVARDRVAAARALRQRHPEVDLIVSDDGLQHRRLARDAEVIVFDERGIGNGWLLPAGPLREPFEAQPPPGSLVLYNAERASTPWPGHLARRALAGAVLLADWWRGAPADRAALDALRGRSLLAVAGLARPQRFFAMLRDAGLTIDELALPDHHDFSTLPLPASTRELVLTEKDAVKLAPDRIGDVRVWVVALDFAPDPAFAADLIALLPGPARRP